MCSSSCASIDNDYKSATPKINADHDIFQVPSSASHRISDIQVITFGGMSSRFWVLRKHISYMPKAYLTAKSMPFFAWQCISLTLAHREVDIVVKDDKDQNNLVKYILYKMRTIDGRAGSADQILKQMEKQGLENYKKKKSINNPNFGLKDMPHAYLTKVRLRNRLKVMRQTYQKYIIIKFRIKVSWIAFKHKMTISELFCTAIKKTLDQYIHEGRVQVNRRQQILQSQIFTRLQKGVNVNRIFLDIIKLNSSKIKGSYILTKMQNMIKQE